MQEINKKTEWVEVWVVNPFNQLIQNSKASGIVLLSATLLALILANSTWAHFYHQLWDTHFLVGFGGKTIDKSLHHWINDGLMAMFFFVVGLELKREFVADELRNPKNAILPIAASLGGMLVPAILFLTVASSAEVRAGWGIPMATDIAFALGIIYFLGDKIPHSIKVFLTVLAIVDDLGAVLVIAFFYSSEIDFLSLTTGFCVMALMIGANLIGVRNSLFYGIMGIGGLWLAFLMSGVHATIAAVLAALTIPCSTQVRETYFMSKARKLLARFETAKPNQVATVTHEQFTILNNMRKLAKSAVPPLQRLEHSLHPVVAFVVMPIFALCNAGISFGVKASLLGETTIAIMLGLVLGKVLGVVGFSLATVKLKLASLPVDMNIRHLLGVGFLAGIGFTMSLFIADLAYQSEELILQAKFGILLASVLSGAVGFALLSKKTA
jgi:NhaA family Na+:H+ antiporter